MMSRSFLGALVFLAACRDEAFVASDSNELAVVMPDASPSNPTAVAPAPADLLVDLLHAEGAIVSVSSKVANAKDFPEHLVDGKPETAWNSKTGDVKGWIAFRVPVQSRVTRVEITAGYDKGDVFQKNHRISRVRISREGVVLADTTLDPEKRELQGIDLEADGGDFLVEVLETKPGTEKKWKELTVSEFRVLGFARGASMSARGMPRLAIGGLEGIPKPAGTKRGLPRGPFPTVEALCAAWDSAVGPRLQSAFDRGDLREQLTGPHCARTTMRAGASASEVARGPFTEAQWVHLSEEQTSGARLILRTAAGYSITEIDLETRHHGDPGCGHVPLHFLEDAELVRSDVGRDVVIVRTLAADGHWAVSDGPNPSGIVERAYACDVDAEGVASCQGPLEVGRYSGWPAGWDQTESKWPAPNPEEVAWSKRMKPTLGPAGDLRAVAFSAP